MWKCLPAGRQNLTGCLEKTHCVFTGDKKTGPVSVAGSQVILAILPVAEQEAEVIRRDVQPSFIHAAECIRPIKANGAE